MTSILACEKNRARFNEMLKVPWYLRSHWPLDLQIAIAMYEELTKNK